MRAGKKKIWIRTSAWLLAVVLVAAAWSAAPTMMTEAAGELELTREKIKMYPGQKKTLELTEASEAEERELIWNSSNPAVAEVDERGTVTAIGLGKAEITAQTTGGESATCLIKVGKAAKEIKLDSAGSVMLQVGETSQIKAKVTPAKAYNKKLAYKVSEDIIQVDENGMITALEEGQAIVTIVSKAKNEEGKKVKKKIRVFVSAAEESDAEGSSENTENSNTGGSGTGGGVTGGTTGGGTGSTQPEVSEPITSTQVSGNHTTYVLNKAHQEEVTATITVNGQSWTQSGTTSQILNNLENTWLTKENSAGTIKVSRPVGEDWWTVTDPTTGTVLFRVKAQSGSGELIVEQVEGQVDVVIH